MNTSRPNKTRGLVYGAATAALYAGLTFALAPISFGQIQLRVAEALCILPYFFPTAAPGLFIGCLAANLLCGAEPMDVIFGSLATFAAAAAVLGIKKAGWSPWLIPLPSVIFNALVIGALNVTVYALPFPYWLSALYVAGGQAAACYGIGMPLYFALRRTGTTPSDKGDNRSS